MVDLFSLWSLFRLHVILAVIPHLSKYFILYMFCFTIFDGNMQHNFNFFVIHCTLQLSPCEFSTIFICNGLNISSIYLGYKELNKDILYFLNATQKWWCILFGSTYVRLRRWNCSLRSRFWLLQNNFYLCAAWNVYIP